MKRNVLWVLGLLLGATFAFSPVSNVRAEDAKKDDVTTPKKDDTKKEEPKKDDSSGKKKPSLPKADTVEKWIGEKLADDVKAHITARREEIQKDAVSAGADYDAFGEYKKYLASLLTPAQMDLYNHKGKKKEDKKDDKKDAPKDASKDAK